MRHKFFRAAKLQIDGRRIARSAHRGQECEAMSLVNAGEGCEKRANRKEGTRSGAGGSAIALARCDGEKRTLARAGTEPTVEQDLKLRRRARPARPPTLPRQQSAESNQQSRRRFASRRSERPPLRPRHL